MPGRLVDHDPAESLVLEERVVGNRHPEGESQPGRQDQESASPEREVDGVSASHRNGFIVAGMDLPGMCNRGRGSGIPGIPGGRTHPETSASRRFLTTDATTAVVRMAKMFEV